MIDVWKYVTSIGDNVKTVKIIDNREGVTLVNIESFLIIE